MTTDTSAVPASGPAVGRLELDRRTRQLTVGEYSVRLSRTEAALLHVLMVHTDEVVAQEEIFARVWGYDFRGDTNIIHTYISYLRRKLPATGARIRTVRGRGYLLCASDAECLDALASVHHGRDGSGGSVGSPTPKAAARSRTANGCAPSNKA